MALVVSHNEIGDISGQMREVEETLKEYTRAIQHVDREIGDTQKEKGLLETTLMLVELQKKKLEVRDRINAARPDPEVAAKLQDLRNQLKLQVKKGEQDEKIMDTTVMQYEKKQQRLKELRQQLEDTKAKTNWAHISKGHHQNRDFLGQENKLKELKATVKQMAEEQEVQRKLLQKKAQLIDQLSRREKELDEKEAKLEELKVEIKDAENTRDDHHDELRTLKRIHQRKENLIRTCQRDAEVNDPQQIKRLENDKKVLQFEIAKHANSRRANAKTIHAQYFRIHALESKLGAIAVALKALKKKDMTEEELMAYRPKVQDSTVEQVDAALFEEAQRNLEQARKDIEVKDALILQKDVTIEVQEKKTDILVNAKESLIRRLKRETDEKEREKRALLSTMERDERSFQTAKEALTGLLRDIQ